MPSMKLYSKFLAAVLMFNVVANAATNFIPLAPVGNVAPAPLPSGQYTFYYQVSSGAILGNDVSGPFTYSNSTTITNALQLAPPGQALYGTPIAAYSTLSLDGTSYNDVHVFFLAANCLLSELYWTSSTGWLYGSACTTCIDQAGFFAVPCQTLYAFAEDGVVHVGFISAGSPQTLSEAVKTPNGAWSVATLPNA